MTSLRKVSLSKKIDARQDPQGPDKRMDWQTACKHPLHDMDINIFKLDIAIFQVLFLLALKTLCYHNTRKRFRTIMLRIIIVIIMGMIKIVCYLRGCWNSTLCKGIFTVG